MARYSLKIAYDGTNYSGWQIQKNANSIQAELQKVLKIILKQPIKVVGSGRTDAGVHAMGQIAHFDTSEIVNEYKLKRSMNGLLSRDISILDLKKAGDDFHARKTARKKTYIYYVLNNKESHPLLQKRAYFLNEKLDLSQMINGAVNLIGEHDFSSFKASDCSSKTQTRVIYDISIQKIILFGQEVIEFSITGSGFLKHMVRNIIGTILLVGINKISANNVIDILNSRDRINAGPTAPPWGLYLKEIEY